MKTLNLLLALMISVAIWSQQNSTKHRLTYIVNKKEIKIPEHTTLKIVMANDTIEAIRKGKKFEFPAINSEFKILFALADDKFESPKFQPEVLKNNIEIKVIKITDLASMPKTKDGRYEFLDKHYTKIDNAEKIAKLFMVIFQQNEETIAAGKYRSRQIGFEKIIYKE
jgi:hypothetical protein